MIVEELVVVLLQIIGHNVRMRFVGDRFQDFTETTTRHFKETRWALYQLGKILIVLIIWLMRCLHMLLVILNIFHNIR